MWALKSGEGVAWRFVTVLRVLAVYMFVVDAVMIGYSGS